MDSQNLNVMQRKSAFEQFKDYAFKAFGGILFLLITIAITTMTILQLVTLTQGLGNVSAVTELFEEIDDDDVTGVVNVIATAAKAGVILGNGLPLLMLVLSTIGCWLVWIGARTKKSEFAGKLGLARVYPGFLSVTYWVSTVSVGLTALVSIGAAITAANAAKDFGDSVGYGDEVSSVADVGVGAIIAIFALIIAVFVLILIRYGCIGKMAKSIKSALATGTVARISPVFFCVLTFIGAFFVFSSGVSLLASSSLVSSILDGIVDELNLDSDIDLTAFLDQLAIPGIFNMLYAVAQILLAVLCLVYNGKFKECVALEAQEAEDRANGISTQTYQNAQPQYAPQYAPQARPQYAQPQTAARSQYAPQYAQQPGARPQYAPQGQPQFAPGQAPQYAQQPGARPQYAPQGASAQQFAQPAPQPQFAAPQYAAPDTPVTEEKVEEKVEEKPQFAAPQYAAPEIPVSDEQTEEIATAAEETVAEQPQFAPPAYGESEDAPAEEAEESAAEATEEEAPAEEAEN